VVQYPLNRKSLSIRIYLSNFYTFQHAAADYYYSGVVVWNGSICGADKYQKEKEKEKKKRNDQHTLHFKLILKLCHILLTFIYTLQLNARHVGKIKHEHHFYLNPYLLWQCEHNLIVWRFSRPFIPSNVTAIESGS
jgi:hypothetical protein